MTAKLEGAARARALAELGEWREVEGRDANRWIVDLLSLAASEMRPTGKKVKVFEGSQNYKNRTVPFGVFGTSWDGSVVIVAKESGELSVSTEN